MISLAHQIPGLKESPITKMALFWSRRRDLPREGLLSRRPAPISSVRLTRLAVAEERAHPGYLRDHKLPVFLATVAR